MPDRCFTPESYLLTPTLSDFGGSKWLMNLLCFHMIFPFSVQISRKKNLPLGLGITWYEHDFLFCNTRFSYIRKSMANDLAMIFSFYSNKIVTQVLGIWVWTNIYIYANIYAFTYIIFFGHTQQSPGMLERSYGLLGIEYGQLNARQVPYLLLYYLLLWPQDKSFWEPLWNPLYTLL